MDNKLIFESIEKFEQYLDENLPRDLAKAYKHSLTHGDGPQAHSDSDHNIIVNRRQATYDYGNSSYEELTPDEAIEYVRQDKHNIENLRIIFRDNLVEFEVRPNGTIYAIYGDDEQNVMVGDREYKNIRFAPYRKVLQNAQKIYKTDEYEHRIANDAREERANKSFYHKIYKMTKPGDPGYDPHSKYQGLMDDRTNKLSPVELDTGNHWKNNYYDINNKVKENEYSRYFYKLGAQASNLNNLLEVKQHKYAEYDQARKALKKLEREKDTYSDEDYEAWKQELYASKEVAKMEYDAIIKEITKSKDQLFEVTDEKVLAFNKILRQRIKLVDSLLDKAFALQGVYEKIQNQVIAPQKDTTNSVKRYRKELNPIVDDDIAAALDISNEISDADAWSASEIDFTEEFQKLKNISIELLKAKKNLEEILESFSENDNQAIAAKDKIDTLANEFTDKLNTLEAAHKQLEKIKLKDIKYIENTLDIFQANLDKIQKHTAEVRAQKAAKNREVELDPSIQHLVTFKSFTD